MKRIVLVLVVMCLFGNVRVNGQGNWVWARQATGNGFQEGGMSMAADPLGNAYEAGWFRSSVITFYTCTLSNSSVSSNDMFIAKIDSTQLSVGILEHSNQSITLFPNPTSTSFTITSIDKIESVRIYNVLGEVIWQNKYNNVTTATIDFTGNISSPSGRSGGAGIYFVEIKTENGIVRKKVVKE